MSQPGTAKLYLSADSLLEDAFRLGIQVWDSGFRPTVVIGLWRGGTPIAVAVHELLDYLGAKASHYPIRTASYVGIGQRAGAVQVLGLDPVAARLGPADRVLFVDDVFDTGLSIHATLARLSELCGGACPRDVRVATVYYKPGNNRTGRRPDFHVHETDRWLVFPHELDGLSVSEILEHKPGASVLREVLGRCPSA